MIKQISLLLAHPWKNAFGHHLEKSTIAPLEKKLSYAHAPFRVD